MRSFRLDIIRVLACLMIVAMHSPLPLEAEHSIFLSTLSYLTAPGIGLFFMLSGALLLPVKADTGSFLKKRLYKIAVPTLIWTLLYLLFDWLVSGGPLSWRVVFSIPFSSQGNPTFWFLYTLIGLYLIAPVISKWLESSPQKELSFYLALWAISLCYPILKSILDINTSQTGILYYLSGYIGYFVLGYYLRRYHERIRLRYVVPAAVIAYGAPVICKALSIPVDFYSVFWYLSIFVVVQCVIIWLLVFLVFADEGKTNKSSHIVTWVSQKTFGVYLVHFFVIRYVLLRIPVINSIQPYYLQTVVIIVLAFILSISLSFLVSLLPGSKYLVGVNRRS